MTVDELIGCLEMLRELGHGDAQIYIGSKDEAMRVGDRSILNFNACENCAFCGEACGEAPDECRGTKVPIVLIGWAEESPDGKGDGFGPWSVDFTKAFEEQWGDG